MVHLVHTGQHLLSAVCDEITGADTVSWELHASNGSATGNEVMIDLALPQLIPEQIQVPFSCLQWLSISPNQSGDRCIRRACFSLHIGGKQTVVRSWRAWIWQVATDAAISGISVSTMTAVHSLARHALLAKDHCLILYVLLPLQEIEQR